MCIEDKKKEATKKKHCKIEEAFTECIISFEQACRYRRRKNTALLLIIIFRRLKSAIASHQQAAWESAQCEFAAAAEGRELQAIQFKSKMRP
jgi:hypothetical protein